jgi:glycosyltransferase involved in cell wall biosynthesis
VKTVRGVDGENQKRVSRAAAALNFLPMSSFVDPPWVSVVTPSLNSGEFIEETIRSVLTQPYPRLEYLVMDGGSTDGTLGILEKFRGRLQWVSQPDHGAADAVNRGIARTKGSIVAWLSADDTYLPGAVAAAVQAFRDHPEAGVVHGEGIWVDRDGNPLGRYPTRDADHGALAAECVICQPAAFIRRDVFEQAGGLDAGLEVCYDYELWMRVAQRHALRRIPQALASSRMHAANKSLGHRRTLYREAFRILRKHYGYVPYPWAYGYANLLLHRRDQFFQPMGHSASAFALSLPLGLRCNWNTPGRFLDEWLRQAALAVSRTDRAGRRRI